MIAIAGVLERLHERRAREEMRVRAIEDPALRVSPAAREQAQPHRPVRHVRRGQDDPPLRAQERTHPREERFRIAQVLDQVAAENDVERARLERELHRLDVPDQHVLAHLTRHRGSGRVELEADDGAAACDQRPSEISARAADVEDALVAPHERKQLRVAAVRVLVERDVPVLDGSRHVRPRRSARHGAAAS